MEEQEFLKTYDITKYDRPSVTADIAIFAIRSREPDSYRHDPERSLSILLVRRGNPPFKDCWALPGGFLKRGERIEDCAAREVEEETGVRPNALMAVSVFSEPGRDPRGWILSQLFASVLPDGAFRPKGGDDAAEASWFTVDPEPEPGGILRLRLSCGEREINARVRTLDSRFGHTSYAVIDSGGLAFDHAAMIASALSALRARARSFDMIFDFLPGRFTLTDLQRVWETVTGEPVQSANFRRKTADLVTETDAVTEGAGHRPARLYERRQTKPTETRTAQKGE